jgi:hypothetical protein
MTIHSAEQGALAGPCAATAMIELARAAGIDVFVIPRLGLPEGSAWWSGRRYINIIGEGRDLDVARVAAHELAHHSLQHTTQWTSQPRWQQEMQAELLMLEFLSGFVTAAELTDLKEEARSYLRPMIQSFLDAGIVNHGEIEAGEWAGCVIDPVLRASQEQAWTSRSDDEEIPF